MLLKTIYHLEPSNIHIDEEAGYCSLILKYNNIKYLGIALCSPQDQDFFSEKVGLNIALSRARIKLLQDVIYDAKLEFHHRSQMYYEVCNNNSDLEPNPDPYDLFFNNVIKSEQRFNKLKEALKQEKKYLNDYLQKQKKFIESIKKIR